MNPMKYVELKASSEQYDILNGLVMIANKQCANFCCFWSNYFKNALNLIENSSIY